MSEKHVRVGVATFIFRDGKFLMLKRKGKHGSGTWSVPGGWQEVGETFEETSKRETAEEVGCEIKNIHFAAITNNYFPGDDIHSVSVFMSSDWKANEPQNLEPEKCDELRWVDFESLPSPLFLPWEQLLKSEFIDKIREELAKTVIQGVKQ